MKKKILCLQSHPIQYFSPLFKEIQSKDICEFKVYYCSDSSIKGYIDRGFGREVKWDIPLLEGYRYEFLKNYSPKPGTNLKFYNLINPGIIKAIIKEKPDIVWVHGWAYITIWLAILTCKVTRTKIWMKCESPLNQELLKSKTNLFVKKILLQFFLFKLIDKFLYIGQENKEFYLNYKVPERKLIFSPYAVDNERFLKAYDELKDKKVELKNELNISENKIIILFSGKLMPKKRPLDLLEAFIMINNPDCVLVFMGDGELRSAIEKRIEETNISNVIITGFVNQSDIAKYYSVADIFVLPSTIGETWGLVVNEAMNFKLPIVISDRVGCAKDLVIDDVNGYKYPVENLRKLKEVLINLCYSNEKRKLFGEESFNIVTKYSYKIIVNEFETHL